MASTPPNRAGREVAEDVKRAVKRAIHFVGLEEHKVRMVLGEDQSARLVMGGGKPDGWPHELPAISVEVLVTTNGDIHPVKVFCRASDADPVTAMVAGGLRLKDYRCDLADLPRVLKELWAERQELVARQKAGEEVRSFTGGFEWQWSEGF